MCWPTFGAAAAAVSAVSAAGGGGGAAAVAAAAVIYKDKGGGFTALSASRRFKAPSSRGGATHERASEGREARACCSVRDVYFAHHHTAKNTVRRAASARSRGGT